MPLFAKKYFSKQTERKILNVFTSNKISLKYYHLQKKISLDK